MKKELLKAVANEFVTNMSSKHPHLVGLLPNVTAVKDVFIAMVETLENNGFLRNPLDIKQLMIAVNSVHTTMKTAVECVDDPETPSHGTISAECVEGIYPAGDGKWCIMETKSGFFFCIHESSGSLLKRYHHALGVE